MTPTYSVMIEYVVSRALWKIRPQQDARLALPKVRYFDTQAELLAAVQGENPEVQVVLEIYNPCTHEHHALQTAKPSFPSRDNQSLFVMCPCGRPRQVPRREWEAVHPPARMAQP